jgi:hypothetical protein
VKDGVCEELDRVFDKFPKYHMKILLWDFTPKSRQGKHFQSCNWDWKFAWN